MSGSLSSMAASFGYARKAGPPISKGSAGSFSRKARAYLTFIDFTRRHPVLSRTALRLASVLPPRDFPSVASRLYMGGRALDAYDVDLDRGIISLGGLEWRIHGSEYIEITHRVLGRRMGRRRACEVIYDMAFRTAMEALQQLDYESLFPPFAASLLREPPDRVKLEADPVLSRFYNEMVSMLLRLAVSECGWGNPECDSLPVPSQAMLRHSVEVYWISRSEDPYWEGLRNEPVCYAFAGILAGFFSHIAGERLEAKETQCAITGEPYCVFTLSKASQS